MQLQTANIVNRAPISAMEMNELREKNEEQQKKINNSKMLGTPGARLDEELLQLKLEGQKLDEQRLEIKKKGYL